MQKFVFVEAHVGWEKDLGNITAVNALLEQGWRVKKINSNRPSKVDNVKALILLEKKDKKEQKTEV